MKTKKGDGDQETREGQKEKENVVKHNEIGKDKKKIKRPKKREKQEIQENGSRKRDREKKDNETK